MADFEKYAGKYSKEWLALKQSKFQNCTQGFLSCRFLNSDVLTNLICFLADITSMQGQCGHKSEGDDEPEHSSIDIRLILMFNTGSSKIQIRRLHFY